MTNTDNTPATAHRFTRRLRRTGLALAGASLVLAACGGSDSATPATVDETPATQPAEAAPPTDAAAPAAVPAVTIGATPLGDALVGERGLTLYGFTNDVDAASVCYGTCAEAWPPVIVDADWTVAPGLDAGIFNATVRDDGQLQLVAGKWPLYYFAGDATSGDINGQGSGDVWFVAGTDGVLIDETSTPEPTSDESTPTVVEADGAPAPVSEADSDLGQILVDAEGLTLYGFADDVDGDPTCNDACADAWPPLIVESESLPAGLDERVFSVVTRDDGTNQLKAGAWPLFYFAGDAAAGETNGQASGDVWFVVSPDGGLVKDEPASFVATAETDLGDILVDADGLTLYGFVDDAEGTPTCNDACAEAWPALIVEGDSVPAGLDERIFSVVTRDDGTNQLKAGAWPLYYFASDAAAGDTNGHGTGDVWFVVSPDGGLVEDAPAAAGSTDDGY